SGLHDARFVREIRGVRGDERIRLCAGHFAVADNAKLRKQIFDALDALRRRGAVTSVRQSAGQSKLKLGDDAGDVQGKHGGGVRGERGDGVVNPIDVIALDSVSHDASLGLKSYCWSSRTLAEANHVADAGRQEALEQRVVNRDHDDDDQAGHCILLEFTHYSSPLAVGRDVAIPARYSSGVTFPP